MKNLILIITVSLFSVNSFAQLTYNWVPQDTIIIDNLDPTAYSEYLIEQQNITNDTLVLGVEVVYNTIPITWDGMICIYGTCFGEIPVAGTFNQMDPIFDTLKGYTKLSIPFQSIKNWVHLIKSTCYWNFSKASTINTYHTIPSNWDSIVNHFNT
jgi:hypothetical protein